MHLFRCLSEIREILEDLDLGVVTVLDELLR